jgi:hypothetical protein
MSIPFHILTAAGIAHVAAAAIGRQRVEDGRRPPVILLILVGALAILSHGILDGLKHGYPFPPMEGIAFGAVLGLVWCWAVRPPLTILFAIAMVGVLTPDIIDLGPDILRSKTGIRTFDHPHIFPWHWNEGSGSMYPGTRDPARDMNLAANQKVSLTNHGIVVAFCSGGILCSLWAFGRRRTV